MNVGSFQVYNPLLTYQNENDELDVPDGTRTPSGKAPKLSEDPSVDKSIDESEEVKGDEKV